MKGKSLAAMAAAAVVSTSAGAQVVLSEVFVASFGQDMEYIEIVNLGAQPVDITDWRVELWDADVGLPTFGGADGMAPYYVEERTVLAPGEAYAWGNQNAIRLFGSGAFRGPLLPYNAIENESFTIVLADAEGRVHDAGLVRDADLRDRDGANRAGEPIQVNFVTGPDGLFMPAGFYRRGSEYFLLDFFAPANGSFDGGTPGFNQIEDRCGSDVNGDGVVNVFDLVSFCTMFRGGYVDMNGDGDTTVADLLAFLASFRTGC